jgi:hypothetical protein
LIEQCEANTANVCGTWTLNADRTYAARWSQGSAAIVRVERFDATGIVLTREDLPGTTTPTMRARYTAVPTGRSVTNGVVVWTVDGLTFSGSWTASW